MVNIKEIFEDYAENLDIFNDEPEKIQKVKHIIWNVLDETERRLILIYAELGNMRDCAKELRVSASTICIYIGKIRMKIKENM